jgi:hypothetical protein
VVTCLNFAAKVLLLIRFVLNKRSEIVEILKIYDSVYE